ncbi:hypothetical protein [Agromyces archimandritae]|uniref:hypothetical protein n=1 Tax=Agromyces archimandritae TaxID=2781962 RepID=UPI001FD1C438|nr:hypothetical protein [Agromyces archimandritae]
MRALDVFAALERAPVLFCEAAREAAVRFEGASAIGVTAVASSAPDPVRAPFAAVPAPFFGAEALAGRSAAGFGLAAGFARAAGRAAFVAGPVAAPASADGSAAAAPAEPFADGACSEADSFADVVCSAAAFFAAVRLLAAAFAAAPRVAVACARAEADAGFAAPSDPAAWSDARAGRFAGARFAAGAFFTADADPSAAPAAARALATLCPPCSASFPSPVPSGASSF